MNIRHTKLYAYFSAARAAAHFGLYVNPFGGIFKKNWLDPHVGSNHETYLTTIDSRHCL